MFSIPTSLAVFPTTMLIRQQNLARNVFLRVFKSAKKFTKLRTRRHVEQCMVRSLRTIPDLTISIILRNKNMATVAHRGSHDKISACDWLDTLHRGSKWQEVTIFSNIRTADRGSKSQSHFTNILRTKN